MAELKSQIEKQRAAKKTYQTPTASKTRLDNIVAANGSIATDLDGLRGTRAPQ